MRRQPIRSFWERMLVLAALLMLPACAPYEKKPLRLDPNYSQLNLQRVAVVPVVFRDQPSDRYVGHNFAVELRHEVQRALQARGYEVLPASATTERQFPYSYRLTDPTPAGIAALAPAGADAVLVVWIDHFLDVGTGNGRGDDGDLSVGSSLGLDVYATADLVAVKSQQKVWSAEGYGYEDRTSFPSLTHYLTVSRLADSLLSTLPPGMER